MTKLYFDCPIKALYMMKEFGVGMLAGDQGHYQYKHCRPYTIAHFEDRHGRFYIDPASEKIFEPKMFDLGWNDKYQAPVTYQSIAKDEKGWFGDGKYYGLYEDGRCKIIMRNGKQFFTPSIAIDSHLPKQNIEEFLTNKHD